MTETSFDPTDPASYPHWADERVRYSDTDALGHVNNNAYGVYFETARLHFFRDSGIKLGRTRAAVVVRITMNFLRELTWPNDVRIGTRMTRLGGKSFTYAQALFVGDRCHATAETVSAMFDLETRQSFPLPDELRARFASQV